MQRVDHLSEIEKIEVRLSNLLDDLTLLHEIGITSSFGFLVGLLGAQPELAGTRNVLGDAETRVIKVAGLVSRERLRTPHGQLLKPHHRIGERRYLNRNLGQSLPVRSRRRDHWALG